MTDDMTADETIAFDGILAAQRLASKTAREAEELR